MKYHIIQEAVIGSVFITSIEKIDQLKFYNYGISFITQKPIGNPIPRKVEENSFFFFLISTYRNYTEYFSGYPTL